MYAASVQRFYYFANTPSSTTFVNWIVKHGPLSNILPDVRDIVMEVNGLRWRNPVDTIRSIKCDKLHTLDILAESAPTNTEILSTLVEMTSRLRSLTLSDVCLSSSEDVHELIERQKGLRFLKIRTEANQIMEIWNSASGLPDLQEINITTYATNHPDHETNASGFPSLTTLRLVLPTTDFLSSFIGSVASTKVQTLEVGCNTGNVFQVASMGLDRFPQLLNLEVRWNLMMRVDPSSVLSHHTHLTRLVITGVGISTSIDDEALKRIALAFPSLSELKLLEPMQLRGGYPFISLQGLQALAQHCPSLHKLTLSVDAQGLSEDLQEPEFQGLELLELNLRTSAADEETERIAQFIAQLWPNHRTHMTTWRASAPEKGMWDKILAEVRRLLVGPK